MEKMLEKYLRISAELDAKVESFLEEDENEQRFRFLKMAAEAEKGRLKADMIQDIGPVTAAFLVSKLDSDFTFEDFLAEFDRIFSK